MDKKELQNLIDRISLTGPEGIKKIKKVLKELSDDSSSSSMGEDEEYTIAQALNDLNDRIEGLQKQLIPQKHILRILNSTEGRVPMQECLALLELDGETPTCEQLLALLPFDNTEIIDPEDFSLKVTALKVTSDGFVIFCGHPYSTGIDSASAARIDVSSTQGMITTEIV